MGYFPVGDAEEAFEAPPGGARAPFERTKKRKEGDV